MDGGAPRPDRGRRGRSARRRQRENGTQPTGAWLARGTASFLVDPAAPRRGIGRALGEHVVDWARDAGYRGIQFNAVVETNDAAVHLWQSLGLRVLATVPGAFDHPEHGYVGLHVMFLDLRDR